MSNSLVSLSGILVQVDLEGGYLVLETQDGNHYRLLGESPLLTVRGATLAVRGVLRKDAYGIGFGTPTIEVTEVSQKSPPK